MTDSAHGTEHACARCGGNRADVRVGALRELVAAPYHRPWFRRGTKGLVGVTGVACTGCGHIELYASEPERLA